MRFLPLVFETRYLEPTSRAEEVVARVYSAANTLVVEVGDGLPFYGLSSGEKESAGRAAKEKMMGVVSKRSKRKEVANS